MQRKLTLTEKRAVECFFILIFMLLVAVLRIITVMDTERYSLAATQQSSYKLNIARQRGTIFDANMRPLTNVDQEIYAVVSPKSDVIQKIVPYLVNETESSLRARLRQGKPVVTQVSKMVESDGVICVKTQKNINKKTLSPHLIGYTDGTGHGVSGLQAAFDEILYSEKDVSVSFVCDGMGNIIDRFEATVERDDGVVVNGIKTTIDAEIQAEVEAVTADMRSGAVLVSEVGTGKIRALASYPTFDVTKVEDYLSDPASPLINRAFCTYNVGSVFKTCVAAAALEQGTYCKMQYECVGSKVIEDKTFLCHKEDGHGLMDLKGAISQSCNTYFYTLAEKVGAEAIYNMASSLGFGQRYVFSDGLFTTQETLPSFLEVEKSLQSVANLSIGQGELMLTPISLLSLYEAVANKGIYYRPVLIESEVKGGTVVDRRQNLPTRVMSEETATFLMQSLLDVILHGTGGAAKPQNCTAAGKTATAQTGWKIDGKNVDHSWFCGFFPADNPKYTVVIISENTSGGGTACAPLFARIADAIYNIKLS